MAEDKRLLKAAIESYQERIERIDREEAEAIKTEEAAASQGEIDAMFAIIKTPSVTEDPVLPSEQEVTAIPKKNERGVVEELRDRVDIVEGEIDLIQGLRDRQSTDSRN